MRNIYIVGPSCGGKTSLLHYLKKHAPWLNFPIRIVSRPPRNVDDELENRFMEKQVFLTRRNSPEFFATWERRFENGRIEYYGFLSENVDEDRINVFSGNNALLLYPESRLPLDFVEAHESYFIACVADDNVRKNRLTERSPEYDKSEVRVRIHEESITNQLGKLDLVLNTTRSSVEVDGQKALVFLETLR